MFNSVKRFFFSLILIVFVSGSCFVFSRYIDYKIVAFILLLTVSLLAVLFDIVPVLLSSILSAVIWNFFFIEPKFTFRIGNLEDGILFSMYFIVAIINAVLTYKIRQVENCLLYTSDAADERSSVDLGGRRFIKKKKHILFVAGSFYYNNN